MDAIQALHSRVSAPRLTGTVSDSDLQAILRAGLRAPDHAQLRPWRFLVVSGDARDKLGDAFAHAQLSNNPELTDADLAKARSKPLRAPMILVAVASISEHPRVPAVEQLVSTGAAVHSMSIAAYALGLGAMWRTGAMAYHPVVHQSLGLGSHEQIIGFLYLGQVDGKLREPTHLNPEDHVSVWQ